MFYKIKKILEQNEAITKLKIKNNGEKNIWTVQCRYMFFN